MTKHHLAIALILLPMQAAAQHAPAFMAGCWTGTLGRRTIEEVYTTPAANLMQGMTRYLQDGHAVNYEFTRIDITPTGSQLVPHPKGQPAVAFAQKEASANRFVWENLQHDFPQRITYSAPTRDSLVARVEGSAGGNTRAFEYRMSRTKCPAWS